jgi:ABC-2 type transport system permease protein
MLQDLERGVLERFLATPARRSALVFSHVVRNAIQSAIQGVIVLVVALALGATNGGVVGWVTIVLAGALVAAGFTGISTGIALLTRKEATMIAVANFIGLPLLFFSSILIARELIPAWMRSLSLANPVEWAVLAAREPVLPGSDWGIVLSSLAGLLAFALATGAFATWAFRAYQRSL